MLGPADTVFLLGCVEVLSEKGSPCALQGEGSQETFCSNSHCSYRQEYFQEPLSVTPGGRSGTQVRLSSTLPPCLLVTVHSLLQSAHCAFLQWAESLEVKG